MKSKLLIRKLWKLFPSKIAKKYHDYVGLMVPCLKEDINDIIVCLDVTPEVIRKAKEINCDLIISHHPFIYGKKSEILSYDEFKRVMYDELLNSNIAVYSFHTNFDEAKNGMNDALCELLELSNIRIVESVPMARIGELKRPMEVYEFAKYAVNKLGLEYGQLINKGTDIIKSVGIIGGSGSRNYLDVLNAKCDIFLSGDTPYHIRREVFDKGLNYLHVDHEIEKVFCPQMKKLLLNINSSLNVAIVDDVKQAELIIR